MATRTFKGNAPQTRLNGAILGLPTTFTVVSGTGYPTVGPFVVTLDKGNASEEKILCASRSGNTITVTTRGYDDTTSGDHADQATVEHTVDAAILTFLTAHADNEPADPHGQYQTEAAHTKALHDGLAMDHGLLTGLADDDHANLLNVARHNTEHGGAAFMPFEYPINFLVMGSVVPHANATVDEIPWAIVPVPAGRTVTLTKMRTIAQSGTGTVSLFKTGIVVPGASNIAFSGAFTTTNFADVALADDDYLHIEVNSSVSALGLTVMCTIRVS